MGSLPWFDPHEYRRILPLQEEIPIPRKAFRLAHSLIAGGLFLSLALSQAGGLRAQNLDRAASTNAISASIGAFLRGADILGNTGAMLGGEASLHFSKHLSIGTTGGALLNAMPVTESGSGLGTDLRMGYGGLLFGYEARTWRTVSLAGRLLLGAGHASIRAVPVGNELGADNFLVLEPEVLVWIRAAGPVHLGLSVGYRTVFGVQDLPTLVGEDLEGTSLTIVLLIT
jgi:hypothetical protein